mgnify:FL=1
MNTIIDVLESVLIKYALVTGFAVIGVTVWISYVLSDRLTKGRLHGSAIAIFIGLVLAYYGGIATGGSKGISDIKALAGVGIMGLSLIHI